MNDFKCEMEVSTAGVEWPWVIRKYMSQFMQKNGRELSHVILNHADYQRAKSEMKDVPGLYSSGSDQEHEPPTLFGVKIIPSSIIAPRTAILG